MISDEDTPTSSVSFTKDNPELLERARKLGLEGLIGKRSGSRYEAGKRASGCNISYVDIGGDETKAKKKAESKTKYVCPECGLNAWAKPEAKLTCTACETAKEA